MAHSAIEQEPVLTSAQRFIDDLQQLIDSIEQNDTERGLEAYAVQRKRSATMNESVPVLAIDGPSGSGKGTLAAWMATELGWHLLDSGASIESSQLWRCAKGWMLMQSRPCARWQSL